MARKSIVNFELLDTPPAERAANNPWPQWPRMSIRVDYSHAETEAKLGDDPQTIQRTHQGIRL